MSRLIRYLAAPGLVWISLLVRWAFAPYFGQNVTYLQFFPAILAASWFGGFGPGVLATFLAALSALYFLLPPDGIAIGGPADAVPLAVFSTIGVSIAALNGRLREAHRSTEREAAIARSRAERLAAIIRTTVDGIIVIDARGLIESFNPGAERLFGYSEAEVLGRNVSTLMPQPVRDEHDGYLQKYRRTGVAAIIGKGRQVRGRRKDGSEFPLHLSVGEMTIAGERKFTGMLHDLSARVALEEQLRERGALAKLGEMAAMIAHEVKNPLAGIRGAVQVIGGRMPAESTDKPMMAEIVKRVDALDGMMKDLLLYARPPTPKLAPTDVKPILASTAGLLKQDEGSRDVEVQIAGAAPLVPADAEMLKMVFHNLLINGAHAMKGRGRIRVDIGAEGRDCRIVVSDEGPGISPEVRDKIFVPFFTTKQRGTGLGLPTAKRFIEAHDGTITIDCPLTGGTMVTVQLPLL